VDAVPPDQHLAENGRIRCEFHFRERNAWLVRRNYWQHVKKVDVSDWTWERDRTERPREQAREMPPELREELQGLLDRVEVDGGPLLGREPKPLSKAQAAALGRTLNDMVLALEHLLHGRDDAST
jgi:hypothetical protein